MQIESKTGIKTKTAGGTEVMLFPTSTEYLGTFTAEVRFALDFQGQEIKGHFTRNSWMPIKDKNFDAVVAHCTTYKVASKRQNRITLSLSKDDFESAMSQAEAMVAEKIAQQDDDNAKIQSGETLMEVSFYDGEILSGYCVSGTVAQLLTDIGLAKPVEGWGHLVDQKLVDALGTSFRYPDAVAFAQPAIEAAKQKDLNAQTERQHRLDAAIAEAKKTGKPALVTTHTEGCDGSVDECSLDIVATMVNPDGSTFSTRTHTH
jgi:hypothetical protein